MIKLRKIWFKIFKRYEIIEERIFTYEDGDKAIRETCNLTEPERWVLSPREDDNRAIGIVWLCRKKRITE